MKRILFAMAFALMAFPAFAQTPVILSNPADWGPWIGLNTVAGNSQRCVDLNGKVITDHTFNYQPNVGPSAITITITGQRAGVQSTVTTGTTTTGGSIHFTGTYNQLCFVVTTLTGAGATVNGSYSGVNGASAASGSVSVTGDVSVVQPTGSNLHVVVDSGGGGGSTGQGDAIAGVTGGLSMVSTTTAAPTYTTGTVNPLNGQTNGSLRVANTANTTIASGGVASGAIASGAVASGAIASGALASGSIASGAMVDLGVKADDKCTTTDTTPCTLIAVNKGILAQGIALNALAVTDPCDGTIPSQKYYISVGSSEDESQVKATAGTLCGIWARNAHASANAFIKCTNLTAANTTPGSSTILFEMMVPFGLEASRASLHIPFSVALTCYIVTGKAASDATEVGADDVSYEITYQ